MDSDRTGTRDGPGIDWWRRPRAIALLAVFSAPIALLVFAGSLIVVPLIYLAIGVEGVSVALLAISEVRSTSDGTMASDDERLGTNAAYFGVERVEMMTESVKSAARGSEASRREIARMVAHIFEQSRPVPSERNVGSHSTGDGDLAFRTVVDPYLKGLAGAAARMAEERRSTQPANAPRMGASSEKAQSGPAANPPGRGEYLAFLEDVLSNLERGTGRREAE